MPVLPRGEHLILYDGLCGLCNRINQFVLARDQRGAFDFASLQSPTGRSFLVRFSRNPDDLTTFHVVMNHRAESPVLLSKARAALFVAKTIAGPRGLWGLWGTSRLWWAFGMLPDLLLDRGYDLIARNRYRLFGRSESCLLPSAEFKNRFIDV